MSSASVLDDAWNRAQPALSAIRTGFGNISSNDGRVMRVSQLDSELLDQELVDLLKQPLNTALNLLSSGFRSYDAELRLVIELVLYKFSVWDAGASYGAKLQGLRYIVDNGVKTGLAPSGLPRKVLLLHATLTILLPYAYNRLRTHALSRAWPDAPSSDPRRKLWQLTSHLESIHASMGLLNFVAFLCHGRHRTLADRLLKMRLTPVNRVVMHSVSYEFMNRQMVWHAFTEFLVFLLPLINGRAIKRRIDKLVNAVSPSNIYSFLSRNPKGLPQPRRRRPKQGKFASLPPDQCAICAESAALNLNPSDSSNMFTTLAAEASGDTSDTYPIHTPYRTSCDHLYCYHCLVGRFLRLAEEGDEDDAGWECLRCGELVAEIHRYTVEVSPESEHSGSDYAFSSDLDVATSELSGSVGSFYTESMSD